MKPDTLRLFFAIELNETARLAIVHALEALHHKNISKNIRWEKPEKLHITMRFLGSVQSTIIPPLIDAVTQSIQTFQPFQIHLGKIEPFPSIQRARVISISLTPVEALISLAH